MQPDILGIVMVIIAIVGAYIMIVYLRRFTNEERIAMIEKGVDPQFFNVKKAFNTSLPLRASLLMIGGGVGLLLGHFLDRTFDMEEVAYFSMLFICGGIGLGASYLIEENKLKSDERKK
jgi:ABC-type Co2+ transport system permease subunit